MGGGDAPCGTAGKGRAAPTLQVCSPSAPQKAKMGGSLAAAAAARAGRGCRGGGVAGPRASLACLSGKVGRGQTGRPGPLVQERRKIWNDHRTRMIKTERGLSWVTVNCLPAVIVLLK